MRKESCDYCAYRCSCRGIRKAQTAALGYCFDYEQEDSWSNHIDAICALAIATVLIGMGLAAVLHIGLWMLEVIW